MKLLLGFLLALSLALAAFWCVGRAPRIVVVESTVARATVALCATCEGRGQIPCPDCGGNGGSSRNAPCPACKGTGKGALAMGLKSGKHSRTLGTPPPCAACRGTGQAPVRTPCAACGGKGSSPCADCGGSGRVQKTPATTRAAPTLWEQFLALFGVEPDPDAAPQRLRRDGSVPLVWKYVKLKSPGATVRVLQWGPVRREAGRWRVKAQVRIVRPDGTPLTQAYDFEILNREVASSRGVAW